MRIEGDLLHACLLSKSLGETHSLNLDTHVRHSLKRGTSVIGNLLLCVEFIVETVVGKRCALHSAKRKFDFSWWSAYDRLNKRFKL